MHCDRPPTLKSSIVQDVQQNVIAILRDNDVAQALKISIFNSIRNYIRDLLQSNNVTSLASLYVQWKNYDLQKFYELLENASLQKTQDDSQSEPINFANLIVEYFLPNMSSPDQIHLKQPLIEVATKIAEMYPISNLSNEQLQEVLKKVPGVLTNIVNLQKSNGNIWREPLHFLTEYLDKKLNSPEVQDMFSNSSLNWDLVRIDLESNINIELIKYISENNLISTAILFRGWKNLDPQKFPTALKEICQNKDYITYCKTFFFDKLLPVIMAPKNMSDPMKVYYIDIALEFASSLPLTKLSSEEYNKFIESVNDYIKHISDLRDMQFEHWHKLWIFLVRLFGKKLHHSMTLINRLLRVVEHAFRNPSYEQRIRGYDCWKELIDNVSLDSHHISSEKQIRLLLTPLRAKFSKQETVIVKRFEVFVYLIEKLQDKAVLVLKEFLEFCFGEVGEDTDPNKSGQGKSLPELWPRSAKVLLAMLGHSHDSNEHCLETNTEICLKEPVLNSNNISNHYCHTINSVSESCIFLKSVELEQDKTTVLKCFWTSLLNIVLNDNVVKKDECIETLVKVLEKLLKDNDPYCNIIAVEVLKSTIKIDWPKVFPFVLGSLKHFTRMIFLVPFNNESYPVVEKFQVMLCTVESSDVTSKITQNLFHCFAEYQTLESNANFVAQFWIFLANELDDYSKNKCLNFLSWPALHLHHITDSAKEALICEHYKQIVAKFVEKSDELTLGLIKKFEKIVKNNPLLMKNVLTFVTMFTPKTENKEITNITLDILDIMMIVPNTEDSGKQRQNLELYLKRFYELNVTNIHDHDTIKKLCTCLQHILKFKHYDILTVVETSLKSLPESIKWVHGKFLSLDFLMDLFEKETDVSAAEKIHKLIDVFRNVKNPETKKNISSFIPRGGRSAKIAKLVKEIPQSPNKQSDSPTTLRLFGKNVETLSPLCVKGSQLKDIKYSSKTKLRDMKDTPNKIKTSKSKVSIDDESNSKFVLIETEVRLDKSKLTEHQKETLKKRSEDIPALYQDLSQSMTQSLDGSVSNKMDNIGVFKKPDENYSKEIGQSLNIEKEKSTDGVTIENNPKSLDKVQEPSFKIIEIDNVNDTTEFGKSAISSLESESNQEVSKTELKKAAVEAELKKLSMSIVGAEEFFASNSKRKRREKKLDLEGNKETPNKEKKSKESRAITPKADKSNLTIQKQESKNKTESSVVENNELENPELVEVKIRGGSVKRKSISNERTESPSEGPVQVSTTTSEHHTVTSETDNSFKKCNKLPGTSTKEETKNEKSTLNKKRNSLVVKGSSEALLSEEEDIKSKLLVDPIKVYVKSSLEEHIYKTDEFKKSTAEIEMDTKEDHHQDKMTREEISLPMESQSEKTVDDAVKSNFVAETIKGPALIGLELESVILETKEVNVVNKGTHPSNKKKSKTGRKRGWPLGVKRSSVNTKISAEDSETDQSPLRHKLELRPSTPVDIPLKSFSLEESVSKSNKELKKSTAPTKMDFKVYKVVKNINAKVDSHQEKITNEQILPPEHHSTEKTVIETVTINSLTETKDNDTHQSNKNAPKRVKKRGWPLGVKRSPSNKGSSAESTPKNQSPLRNKLELRSQTPVDLIDDTEAALETIVKAGKGINKEKHKRRGRYKDTLLSVSKEDDHCKPFEAIVQAKQIETDVYQFDTEQEMISESMIVPLRSPNKDNKLTVATKSISDPSVKKSLVTSGTSKEEEISSSGRKSKRKSIPTEKFTQSELFKSSESTKQTPCSLKSKTLTTPIPKDSHSNKKMLKKNTLPDEKTQSELFKHTDEENEVLQPLLRSEITSKLIGSDISSEQSESKRVYQAVDKEATPLSERIKQTYTKMLIPLVRDVKCNIVENQVVIEESKPITKNEDTKSNENIFRKGIKRKRPSSEDEDDIIESSQDSSISNASAAKLKLSFPKRVSVDKPLTAEIKQNIEENKRPEEIIASKSPIQVEIGNDKEVTPEEKKRKRGRPAKSPAKQNVDIVELQVTSEVKKRRGRPAKSPLKIDITNAEDKVSTECITTDAQTPNKFADITSDNDITKIEVTFEMKEQTTLKSENDLNEQTQNNDITKMDTSMGEKKSKRGRLRKDPQEESTIHMLETIDRVAAGVVSYNEKPKRSSRKSPLKLEKESEELIQDIIQEVKRQVFPNEFKERIDLDISTQNLKQRTQSQDTQTQDTESIDINDEIQLQLNLPQKPILDETDKEIARMDTASLSLGNLDELKGFDVSSGDETRMETNKTVTENKTYIEDIAESENVIDSSEKIKRDCGSVDLPMDKAPIIDDKIISIDVIFKNNMPESESVINSIEETNPRTESSENFEIAETEYISTQHLVTMDVQQEVTVESGSPVQKEIADKSMGTPGPLESSLPSSPVTGDTPNRTSELLNCTSDISPIGSKSSSDKSSSDDEFVEQRKLVPVALKFDEDVDHEANIEKSPEKADDAPQKIDETSPEKAEKNVEEATSSSPPKDEAKTGRDIKNIAERSSRFFDMVRSGSPTTLRLFNKRKSGLNMSPSASRIKKLMSNVKAPSQSEISDNVSQEDILTFVREVPSPLAVPKSSILKRKHSDTTDDGLSPCPKRKRVNFSDPCTTSKKVFIKEDNALSQCIFGANSDDDLDKQFLEVLAANNIDTPTIQTESDTIETEQSLQIKNLFLLRDDVPIYPDLVDCEESVSVISRKLTSPMFVNALLSKLDSRNIKTIGDLAKLSEISIARLPFKTPMVANVYKALDNYYHKNFKSKVNKEKHDTRRNGEPDTGIETAIPLPRLEVALVKMDVKDELLKIIDRAKSQNMSTDALCSLFFSTADQKEVIYYVKTHFNLESKDLVDEKDFPKIVKHITETVGLPKIFEILTESLESSEDESIYFDCMIKHSIEKRPLSSLIEKRSIGELQSALWENVENGTYTKKQLLDMCFLPFVSSIDLTPVFNKMTVFQIEEIVLTRLKTEEYPVFINRILKESRSNAKVKEELLNHCTISEMTSNIIKKGSPQEVISSFTYMFLSAEKGKDDLVQIFRLVSDSLINVLPPTKLMELSIEFQKKIPIKD